MNNTKHTPGPWTSTHDADVQQPTFHIGTPIEPDVARINDCIEQAEANARLIAAAPESLEALRAVWRSGKLSKAQDLANVGEVPMKWSDPLTQLVYDAISKATNTTAA